MITRSAKAKWEGDLKTGKGKMKFGDGAFSGQYSWKSRFKDGKGTNPEELIGAAHAGCVSMDLSGKLSKAGYTVEEISTEAFVSMEKTEQGQTITGIKLVTHAKVPDIEVEAFEKIALKAKKSCPVSRALSADIEIDCEAHLV